jgi:hypothetical protein
MSDGWEYLKRKYSETAAEERIRIEGEIAEMQARRDEQERQQAEVAAKRRAAGAAHEASVRQGMKRGAAAEDKAAAIAHVAELRRAAQRAQQRIDVGTHSSADVHAVSAWSTAVVMLVGSLGRAAPPSKRWR